MTPIARMISTLQDMGYVVREGHDFQAALQVERERGHQDAVDALTRLVAEDLCRCINCLSEELEALRA